MNIAMLNFKKFFEEVIPGAFQTVPGRRDFLSGQEELPDTNLELPTFQKTGTVSHPTIIKGRYYLVRMAGQGELFVDRKKWDARNNKIPRPGDIMTATWYSANDEKNYKLKDLRFAH